MCDIQEIGVPVYVPEQRSQFPRLLRESLAAAEPELLAALAGFLDQPDPEALLRLEETALRLYQLASSHVVAGVLALLHQNGSWVDAAVEEARDVSPRRTRLRGWRETPICFLGGARMRIETIYVAEDLRGRRGPRRGVGRRRQSGGGFYPLLEALGIAQRATPALRSEVARQVVRGASNAEARAALAERGVELNEKTVRALALGVGARALDQRQARLDAAREGRVFSDELTGKRVVIGVDGGRTRLREGGQRGRRNRKGRRRYATPWREPKLLVVYVIDKRGKKVREVRPLYDATLGNADSTFEILIAELLLRGASKAKEIILTGDGATWIWNRADALAKALGLDPKKIVKVADFYHAVEHLTAVTDLCASWSPTKRKRWVRRMRRHLKAGNVDVVIQAARALCRGRNAGRIRTEVEYFEDRKDRMRYRAYRRRGIPLGSGAVESAIRRVINLRLKGPSIFWRKKNAERVLHMRSYLKAGRWDELMRRVLYRSPDGMPVSAAHKKAA